MRPSLRSTAPALLISAATGGLLCWWAVSVAPASVQTPLAWGAGAAAVALTAAVTAAAHARWTGRQLRVQNAALSLRADQLTADVRRAAEDVRRTAEDARRATEEAARSEANRAAAVSIGANAAGRMQALSTSMLADLREMENRHGDEAVLGDLLHLDHRTAQAGRLADSVAVLTGARSGRRWAKPIVMESILRGAMGRISGYQRVRLHSTSEVAVAGHAAEGVMHALAELLDNAANFSPPTAEVHVYVEEVPAGIVITVEDSGLVMSNVQLRRAERAVATTQDESTGQTGQSDLSGLSGTRLGLAVVGRLARKHGLTVSFRPSARGGTGALMMLPQELITHLHGDTPGQALVLATAPELSLSATPATPPARTSAPILAASPAPAPSSAAAPALAAAPAPAAASTPASAESAGDAPPGPSVDSESESTSEIPELGESGLPKRRRGRTLAASLRRTGESKSRPRSTRTAAGTADASSDSSTTPDGATAPDTATTAAATPAARAARFSSFRKAVQTAPPHSPAPSPPHSPSHSANPTHPEGDPR
ncbi:ATP-binding protein [Streptomyces sp. NPDC088400]|uniref:ATP-binding protein n=1 Tax=Streptomyces sp. NPDC088400 TaxID=3365861 RepID=UPI0037F6E6D6